MNHSLFFYFCIQSASLLSNEIGTCKIVRVSDLGDGFDWDVEHRPGVRYDGLSMGLKQRDGDPKVFRVGAPGRTDLYEDYFLYRIFFTPQVFRCYIDDEEVIEVVSHGMGKTREPFVPHIHLNIFGFSVPEGGDPTVPGAPSGNVWRNEERVPINAPEGVDPQRQLKIDYYAHIPLGTDPEGARTDAGANEDFYKE